MRPVTARSVYEPICVKTPVAGNPIASHANRFPFTLDRLPFMRAMTIRHNADDNNTKEGYGDGQLLELGFHGGLPFDTFCPFGIAKHKWRIEDMVDLLPLNLPGKRGLYKKRNSN